MTLPFTALLRGGLIVPGQRPRRRVSFTLGSILIMQVHFRTHSRPTVKLANFDFRRSSGTQTRREYSLHKDLSGAHSNCYDLIFETVQTFNSDTYSCPLINGSDTTRLHIEGEPE